MSVVFLLIAVGISFALLREMLLEQFKAGQKKQPLTIWAVSSLGIFVLLEVVWRLLDRFAR